VGTTLGAGGSFLSGVASGVCHGTMAVAAALTSADTALVLAESDTIAVATESAEILGQGVERYAQAGAQAASKGVGVATDVAAKGVVSAADSASKSVGAGVGAAKRSVDLASRGIARAAVSLAESFDALTMSVSAAPSSRASEADVEATANELSDMLQRLGPAPAAKALAVLLLASGEEAQQEAVKAAEDAAEEERMQQAMVDETLLIEADAEATRIVEIAEAEARKVTLTTAHPHPPRCCPCG
jgi:hypothetical protein